MGSANARCSNTARASLSARRHWNGRGVSKGAFAFTAAGCILLALGSATRLVGQDATTWRESGASRLPPGVMTEFFASRDHTLPGRNSRVLCVRKRYHWHLDCPVGIAHSHRPGTKVQMMTLAEAEAEGTHPCCYCTRLDVAAKLHIDP